MGIKTKLNDTFKPPFEPYPRIKIHHNTKMELIVLFTSKNSGVVLNQGQARYREHGGYCNNLVEHDYIEYSGEVTLSND